MRSRQRRWNCSSPTASTSSTIRMSGSIETATANPSRACMPDEYVLTGVVDGVLETGELDDARRSVDASVGLRHAEDGPVEEDVLAAAELGVETGTQLEQRRDPPFCLAPRPCRGRGCATAPSTSCSCRRRWLRSDPIVDPAGTSNDTSRNAQNSSNTSAPPAQDRLLEGRAALVVDAERLPQAINDDVSGGHPAGYRRRRPEPNWESPDIAT